MVLTGVRVWKLPIKCDTGAVSGFRGHVVNLGAGEVLDSWTVTTGSPQTLGDIALNSQ